MIVEAFLFLNNNFSHTVNFFFNRLVGLRCQENREGAGAASTSDGRKAVLSSTPTLQQRRPRD